MENLPTSEFQPGSAQYSGAPNASLQAPPITDSSGPSETVATGDSNYVPRPKRIACVVCRRRKLRCDGKRPSCGTCSRLGHECAYDEVRKKSGPKRGYVKQLEARLAQVETLLKGQETEHSQRTTPPQPQDNAFTAPFDDESILALPELSGLENDIGSAIPSSATGMEASQLTETLFQGSTFSSDPQWDLISLGLEEPLPAPDVIEELDNMFFEKIYPMMPIIHRSRYFTSLALAPNMRPPICLRYMMWCHAASVSDKYFFLHNHFYQRSRKYAESDEMKGFGENVISLAHCQTWILIGTYEFRMIYFPRAWLSVGKASRLALMMGLNRLDGAGIDVKQSILPPKDWTEREERRRVFWMAFCTDRYASIGTGWPMALDEGDIMTNLPASEESFLKSKPQRTLRLPDIIAGEGVSTLSPFACVVILASLFGRNLVHIHRPQPQDNDHDLNGEFWKRHRSHDNILLHIALSLPDHLRLPSGMDDVNVIFSNMSIHTSTICLHQAAIFKAEKNKMPSQIITESKRRCLVAANQISSIMKMVSHIDLTLLNPFMSFCLYISARVFVQYLKSRPDDSTVHSSLQFVIGALNALKTKNPLTESFLVQLEVDLEGTGLKAIDNMKSAGYVAQAMHAYCPEANDCGSLYAARQTKGVPFAGSQDRANSEGQNRLPINGMATSLPSRHRNSANTNHAFETPDTGSNFFPQIFQPVGEKAGQGVVDADMEYAQDLGIGERCAPSDHPTPSTMNSSSNTSYSISGADNPSPEKRQRPPVTTSSFEKVPSIHTSSTTESPPMPDMDALNRQIFPNTTTSPFGATTAPAAFPLTSPWDMPPNSATNNVDLGDVNMTSLSEPQWAQFLNGGNGSGWENWRQT